MNKSGNIWYEVTSSLFEASLNKVIFDEKLKITPFRKFLKEDGNIKFNSPTILTSNQIDETEKLAKDSPQVTDDIPFLEVFVNKLVERILPPTIPQRECFLKENRNISDDQNSEQIVSTTILGKNMKNLGIRMETIYNIQDFLYLVITWKNPALTLTFLIVLGYFMFNPINIFFFFFYYLIIGKLIPSYSKKLQRCTDLERNFCKQNIGKSFINVFNNTLGNELVSRSIVQEFTKLQDEDQELNTISSEEPFKPQINFILGLRDFQDMTSEVLGFLAKTDEYVEKYATFKDDQISVLLYGFLVFFIGFIKSFWIYLYIPHLVYLLILIYVFSSHPLFMKKYTQRYIFKNHYLKKLSFFKENNLNVFLDSSPIFKHITILQFQYKDLKEKCDNWETLGFYIIKNNHICRGENLTVYRFIESVAPPNGWVLDPNSQWNSVATLMDEKQSSILHDTSLAKEIVDINLNILQHKIVKK
ncbi:hypothetical protein TBLA_0H02260 [Henningerozyma blattae CBS 6284]|uniref:TECPR1-like DysF domain-containing protein n=1 Tax=Henningerozyma blattae (strain ATCC 34711 / CBS 6284 / DSM 70876 / NBRC 10599 / NRRL Y-10934 / UCD 77-7) TaxID=1071380 RepID=I2H810_HENB6|nr:hypothetical protein TBLA_0H02260 [Tetrapisispora blattae CBS 6284]CCH62512.1 hypothetical protein TBLA_0H02260 [Tetrapisispora blattae CBS 6284]